MEENRPLFRALRLENWSPLFLLADHIRCRTKYSCRAFDDGYGQSEGCCRAAVHGARREQIRTIFLWQGVAIGACGTLVGLALGYGLRGLPGRGIGFARSAGVRRFVRSVSS